MLAVAHLAGVNEGPPWPTMTVMLAAETARAEAEAARSEKSMIRDR